MTVTVSGSDLLIEGVDSSKIFSDLMFGLMDDQIPGGIHEVTVSSSAVTGDAVRGEYAVPLSALQAAMSATISGNSNFTATKLIVREGDVGSDTNFGTSDDNIDAEGEIAYGDVSPQQPGPNLADGDVYIVNTNEKLLLVEKSDGSYALIPVADGAGSYGLGYDDTRQISSGLDGAGVEAIIGSTPNLDENILPQINMYNDIVTQSGINPPDPVNALAVILAVVV